MVGKEKLNIIQTVKGSTHFFKNVFIFISVRLLCLVSTFVVFCRTEYHCSTNDNLWPLWSYL